MVVYAWQSLWFEKPTLTLRDMRVCSSSLSVSLHAERAICPLGKSSLAQRLIRGSAQSGPRKFCMASAASPSGNNGCLSHLRNSAYPSPRSTAPSGSPFGGSSSSGIADRSVLTLQRRTPSCDRFA
jgi:hypothetical protein